MTTLKEEKLQTESELKQKQNSAVDGQSQFAVMVMSALIASVSTFLNLSAADEYSKGLRVLLIIGAGALGFVVAFFLRRQLVFLVRLFFVLLVAGAVIGIIWTNLS